MINNQKPWGLWQKISFRFFFLFLTLTSVMCWQLVAYLSYKQFVKDPDISTIYKPFTGLMFWCDKYIFHTGYDPKVHTPFPGDNHFGTVFYLSLLLLSVLAAIAWSIFDNKRPCYNKLYYWFNL